MPIYEYECRKCGTFEVTQRITESALRKCPKCKGKVSRLLSAPSIQFKGSGWYVTDYAAKNRGGGDSKKSEDTSSSDSKSESKDAAASKSDAPKESSKKESKASDKAA
jgi:putative FmdB family regulatory protein